ncbi:MAG TPA: LLM class flavin-dependent oxidoreductase [Candidatus Dormibacteraeota bacterium]|jgi:alkanesulfonate monooxygenase SsuD/methylene tetrahydromethanopterin reductase-like flavin-dependent oxidoreductase (luciferase family)|nr:LLM class flavin-dependent oxidoreductase [Candidatus Dormibacteraeota bacterium]
MRFFVFLLGQQPAHVDSADVYRELINDAELAEQLGFDGLWVAEHHFSTYCVVPNTLTLLASIAKRTSRIRIGSAVVVLPLHNAVRVAEEAAMVDHLSEGRLELVLGRGFQPLEFAGLGYELADSQRRLSEGIAILKHLWERPDRPFEGPSVRLPALTAMPMPRQRPHPPLWLACGSQRSIEAAMERSLHVVLTAGIEGLGKFQELKRAFETRRQALDGRVDLEFGVQCYAFVSSDPAARRRAIEAARQVHRLGNLLRRGEGVIRRGVLDDPGPQPDDPADDTVRSSTLIGDEHEVADRLAWFAEQGVTTMSLIFRFGELSSEEVRESMARMARLVRVGALR